jgi:hypothetical protein
MRSLVSLVLIISLTGPAFAATDPAKAVPKAGDGWIAFEFPALEGTRSPCCWKGHLHIGGELGCSLEQDRYSYGTRSNAPLEDTIVAYTRVEAGEVTKLKVVGRQCPMDTGGQAVSRVPDTGDKDMLNWLDSLARNGSEDEVSHPALWAMALHASSAASDRLYDLASEQNGDMAKESIFWLGEARGQAGYEALEDLLNELPTGDTRRQINFALSQADSDDAAALLADIARNDRDPEQRADALFWMAQEYPEEAQELILDVIENEDDREILEKAVFALSQLPPDIAGPKLLELAQDKSMPREARRQALFWLAHEGDEESVIALTELLTR